MSDSCPACRRPTRVALTRAGLRLALDPTPSPDGNVIIEQHGDGTIRARVLAGHDPEAPGDTVTAYTRHRCDTPDRRPLCRACELPMGRLGDVGDAELIRLERWVEHPHCDTPAAAARARYAATRHRSAGVQDQLPEAS